jgi:hypothetical protein
MYTHQACGGQLAATAYISDRFFDVDIFATSMIHPPDILGRYRDETQMLSQCYADTDPVVMCRNTICDSTWADAYEGLLSKVSKVNIIII